MRRSCLPVLPEHGEAELLDLLAQHAAATVIHRTGRIPVGDNIVLVIATSSHRQAAFEAAHFLMDYLKTRAPFWKKEHLAAGGSGPWVAALDEDDSAAERWRVE